jgi:predicted nucleic acid-binding protein
LSLLYFDTSALGKRYITEVGSKWVRRQVHSTSRNSIVISKLTTVELASIFARQQRTGYLTAQVAQRLDRNFVRHIRVQYAVMKIDDSTYQHAKFLVKRYSLRTLDAIQLACAIETKFTFRQPITFVSADKQLLGVALGEGFKVEDPNNYP